MFPPIKPSVKSSLPPPPGRTQTAQTQPTFNSADPSLSTTPIDIIVDKLGADIVFFNAAFSNVKPKKEEKKIALGDVAHIFNTLNYSSTLCRQSRIKSVFQTIAGTSSSIFPSHTKVCSFADLLRIHYVIFAGRGLQPNPEEPRDENGVAPDPLSPRAPAEKENIIDTRPYSAFDEQRKSRVEMLQRRIEQQNKEAAKGKARLASMSPQASPLREMVGGENVNTNEEEDENDTASENDTTSSPPSPLPAPTSPLNSLFEMVSVLQNTAPSDLARTARHAFTSFNLYSSSSSSSPSSLPSPIPWTDAHLCLAELGWGSENVHFLGDVDWVWEWRAKQAVNEADPTGGESSDDNLESSEDFTDRVSKSFHNTILHYRTFERMLADLRGEAIATAKEKELEKLRTFISTTLETAFNTVPIISNEIKPLFNDVLDAVGEHVQVKKEQETKSIISDVIEPLLNTIVDSVEKDPQVVVMDVMTGLLSSVLEVTDNSDYVPADNIEGSISVSSGEMSSLPRTTGSLTGSLDAAFTLSVSSGELSSLLFTSGDVGDDTLDTLSVSSGEMSSLPPTPPG